MDPDVAFGCECCMVRSTRNLVSFVQSMVVVKLGQALEENLVKDAKVYHQELTTQSPQAELLVLVKPKKYRFVHGDGNVDLVSDTIAVETSADKVNRSTDLVGDKCQILM